MTPTIAISVVIPAYNEEALIGRCLESLTHQNFPQPYEIIVVNNNSTDKTAEITKTFSVKMITESMVSVVAARQRGLVQSQGKIVVGADCDCEYPPTWLAEVYKSFQNPHVVAAGGPAIAERNPYWAYLIYKFGFGFIHNVYKLTGQVIYLGGFNFAFDRQIFLDLGGYHTYLDFGGDEWDILERLKKKGKVVFNPQAFMHVSTRRYRVGFLKWFFKENLYNYVLNFWLAKIFKKTLIRAQPVRNI